MTEFIKWTSIDHFHNINKRLQKTKEYHEFMGEDYDLSSVYYRAKVKLDGTNAGVQITPEGEVLAQSRSRFITPEDDNYGFAKWVKGVEHYFSSLAEDYSHMRSPVIIFGEWSGLGIQKRCSISKIKQQIFAVFAIQIGDGENALLITSPFHLDIWLNIGLDATPETLVVLPFVDQEFLVDFNHQETVIKQIEKLEVAVQAVEDCDPYVKEHFGVDGLGEGLVLYPQLATQNRDAITELMFKAKGEKHTVVKQKKIILKDPEVVATIDAFVEKFVTTNRLFQGVVEGTDRSYTMQQMGAFLKWVGNDVRKESEDELEVAELKWSAVAKQVAARAKLWYVTEIKKVQL